MKERGMIFNGEMTRAILDGRKTQTRRIMKVQPSEDFTPMNMALETDYKARWYTPGVVDKDGYLQPASKEVFGVSNENEGYSCPFGAVGDRIWVRETWARYNIDQNSHDIAYRATTPADWPEEGRWRPSIHMPRWASRILLEITDVRVERLNSISQEDAQAEGMELTGWRPTYSDPDSGGEVMTPYDNFAELWSSICGDESWKANPWVWVISFKRVEGGAA
ncbi:morphogenetic protein [Klebsiella variicola]|nr:morphogenetic protein [Klebsiella variicola]